MGTTTSQLAGLQYRLPYTNRDFASLMAAIKQLIPQNDPDWNDVQFSNYGIAILSNIAALADWLAFYADRAAAETYILTCLGKSSIANILQLLNYQIRNAVAAYTTIRVSIPTALNVDVLIPIYTEFADLSGSNRFVTTQGATIAAGDLFVDIPARQGQWTTETFTSDGSAQQRLILGRNDIADGFIRVWVGLAEWDHAEDNTFVAAGPQDPVFRLITNSINAPGQQGPLAAITPELIVTTVEFGDNLEGMIPPQGSVIRVSYLTTLGDSIRVPTNSVNQVVSQIFDANGTQVQVTVTNTEPAAGGDSSESLYAARANYPQQFRTMRRAVTVFDFTAYAQSFPGALLVKVYDVNSNADNDSELTPDRPVPVEQAIPFNQARVYAVPRNNWSSYSLNQAMAQWFASRCDCDRQVVVLTPTPVPVDIIVTLRIYSNFDPQSVKFAVIQAIQSFFTLARDGKIQIGGAFHASQLITVIQQVPGVSSLDFVSGVSGQPPAQDITPNFDEILQIGNLSVKVSNVQL